MITQKDLNFFRALKRKLEDASFPIHMREASALIHLQNWMLEFEKVLEKELEKQASKAKPKEKKEVKADNGSK